MEREVGKLYIDSIIAGEARVLGKYNAWCEERNGKS